VLSDVEAQLKQETISVNELSLANQDLEAQFNVLKELLGEHSIEMTVVKLKARIKSLEEGIENEISIMTDKDIFYNEDDMVQRLRNLINGGKDENQ